MLAIDILKWPGMNQAFLFSFFVTLALIGIAVLYGKRRPVGKVASWGEAMAGSAYAFFVMFLAFGVVPHQWLTHVQNELGWQADKQFLGPGGIFEARPTVARSRSTSTTQQIGDILVVGIYAIFLGVFIWIFVWWQKRGAVRHNGPRELPRRRSAARW